MNVSFTVVFVDGFKTRWMRAADIFESFKVMIRPPVPMVGEWDNDLKDFFNEAHLKKMVDNINAELKKIPQGGWNVLNPEDRVAFIYSPLSKNYYFDPTINVVSDGNGWTTAVKAVESLGLTPIEDKHPLFYKPNEDHINQGHQRDVQRQPRARVRGRRERVCKEE
jgi:hypothetical protein